MVKSLKCHCSRAGHRDTDVVVLSFISMPHHAIEFKFSILHFVSILPSIAQLVERRTVVGMRNRYP